MLRNSLYIFLVIGLFAACSTPKDVSYWQDAVPHELLAQSLPQRITLAPGDRISIVVSSVATPEEAVSYNKLLVAMRGSEIRPHVSETLQPYVLDAEGRVVLPELGVVSLGGRTRSEAAQHIATLLREGQWLRDAQVSIELTNRYVSVLGEVERPGRVNFAREDLTLVEALSQTGDLTIKANRRQVMVLRDSLGQVAAHKIDLTQARALSQSPAYYLRPSDVVYVAPSKHRQREASAYGNAWSEPYIYLSLVSVLTSVVALVLAL